MDIYPLIRPLLFRLDPEMAHGLIVRCMKAGLYPRINLPSYPILETRIMGMRLGHPIGLAPGFDKQAEIIDAAFNLGFSFSEIGGVVPLPQPGNPKPRMFRLPQDRAIINRFNFNSVGFDIFAERLAEWCKNAPLNRVVGVNIAKGDYIQNAADAYIAGLRKFAGLADFVTINVSCPNEPDARNLEGKEQLRDLLAQITSAHARLDKRPKLLVKISPDQTEKQAHDIAEVAMNSAIDGIIISNTTAARPIGVTSPLVAEKGGLSGKPVFEMSTRLLGNIYRLTDGKIPLIGCGGVFTGADAYAKIRAGASLVQLYTGMVYEGPFIVARIICELAALLQHDGYATIADAIGADHTKNAGEKVA